MKREYPEHPIIAVGGIIFHGQSVLLVKRNREPGKGQWSLPGGAVELGETLKEALKREISEEVSIKIEIGGLVRLLDRIIEDPENRIRFHYVIADYWGWKVSGQSHPASDISDARFVPLKEIQKMEIHEEVEKTILMAVKMRNHKMAAEVP
ncbi:MAG: NUDIX hydrolase [Deltaproteobacteria bacterium]|nr:MAG: NUDIX hydrolase [Deltaproteobacteria bacterium]